MQNAEQSNFRPSRLNVLFSVLRQLKVGLPHGRQQLQGEGKAELTHVDAVDEHLRVDIHPFAFQATGQLLVGQLLLHPQVLDDGLGLSLVKRLRFHQQVFKWISI